MQPTGPQLSAFLETNTTNNGSPTSSGGGRVGLRRRFKAPISSEARVRIPSSASFFPPGSQNATLQRFCAKGLCALFLVLGIHSIDLSFCFWRSLYSCFRPALEMEDIALQSSTIHAISPLKQQFSSSS
jgi:hypothetical protein